MLTRALESPIERSVDLMLSSLDADEGEDWPPREALIREIVRHNKAEKAVAALRGVVEDFGDLRVALDEFVATAAAEVLART